MVGVESIPQPYSPPPPPFPHDPNLNSNGEGGITTWGGGEDNAAWLVGRQGRGDVGREENNNGVGLFPTSSSPSSTPLLNLRFPTSPMLTSPPQPVQQSTVLPSPSPPPSPSFYLSSPLLRSPSPSPFSPTHASSLTHSPSMSHTLQDLSPFPSPTSSLSPSPSHSPPVQNLTPSPTPVNPRTLLNPFPSPSPSPPPSPRHHPLPDLAPLGSNRRRAASRGLLTRCRLPQGVTGLPCALPPHPRRPLLPRPPLALTCRGPRGAGEARGPSFFTDLCSLWPDIIVR